MAGKQSRCFERGLLFAIPSSFLLLLGPSIGGWAFVLSFVVWLVLFSLVTYYREYYLTGRVRVVEPHVLEWTGENPPYWTKDYIGMHDDGEEFAWECRYCDEYAIKGELEELEEIDCKEFEAYEKFEVEEELEHGNV